MRIRNHVSTAAIAVAAAFTLGAVAPAEADDTFISSKIGAQSLVEAQETVERNRVSTQQSGSLIAEVPAVSSKIGADARPADTLEGAVTADTNAQTANVRSKNISSKIGADALSLESQGTITPRGSQVAITPENR